MEVAKRIAGREAAWRELDQLIVRVESLNRRRFRMRKAGGSDILRLGELYRSACADLMLAEAHHLPRQVVADLHALVGRAHNAVYRASGFQWSRWLATMAIDVPRQLRGDPSLKLSAAVFYGLFLLFWLIASQRPDFARGVVGPEMLAQMEQMYAEPLSGNRARSESVMTGFYIQHNASIGLQCYAWGLTFGLGTLYVLVSNASILGAVFGAMTRSAHADNFFTFVSSHAPFELTAIVFAGAAGLRLGRSLLVTHGMSRLDSLRREAVGSLPTVGVAVFLFILAAFLEGFVSGSALPYPFKAGIALFCAGLLLVYLFFGGRTRSPELRGETWPNPKL